MDSQESLIDFRKREKIDFLRKLNEFPEEKIGLPKKKNYFLRKKWIFREKNGFPFKRRDFLRKKVNFLRKNEPPTPPKKKIQFLTSLTISVKFDNF